MTLKVALVGCGKMADSHAEEIAKLPSARLVAVCDAEPLMAEQLAVRFQVPEWFDDIDRMLATAKPDVLHIVTPPQSHLSITRKAVEAGCHVLVEKPIAMNFGDTSALVDCVTQGGKKMTTGWRVNFDPPALTLAALLAEGVAGDPVHIESFFGYDLSGPYGAAIVANKDHWVRKLPGQLFQNNIDHLLNKLPGFFVAEKPALHANALCFRGTGADSDLPDELRVLLTGRRVTAFANFSANSRPTAHTLTVYGTKETIAVDYIGRTVTFAARPTLPSAIGRLLMAFGQGLRFHREGVRNVVRFAKSDFHFNSGLGLLFARFYHSIVHDTPAPISNADMLWVAGAMDEIFEQIRPAQDRHTC